MTTRAKRYFLPFELDLFRSCGPIGMACGLPAEQISHGLLLLWEHVWRSKNDRVTTGHLKGFFFGGNPCEALLTFGVLEATEDGWRVKGAKEWLRVMSAQSESGKTHSGNLQRGRKDLSGSPPAPTPKKGEAGDKPDGSPPALPATSHQLPATKEEKPVAKKPATPSDPRLHALGLELEADYESVRRERYKHGGAADTQGLKALLPIATNEKIRDRWRFALRRTEYPRVSTFAQLAKFWPDLAAPAAQTKPGSIIHNQTAWGPDEDFATGLAGGNP